MEGDTGAGRSLAGDQEKRGWEVYGRREKRGGKPEKKEKNYTTLCNILQSEKCKEAGTNKIQGRKGYGKQEV